MNTEVLKSLKKAIDVSPDNMPLRSHYAESLLQAEEYEEAVNEFKFILKSSPEDNDTKLGLSKAYHGLGDLSLALVIMEDVINSNSVSAEAMVYYAKLLLQEGQLTKASEFYKKALSTNSNVYDEALSNRLGIYKGEPPQPTSQSNIANGNIMERFAESSDGEFDAIFPEVGDTEDEDDNVVCEFVKPDIDFSDVGGMETIKEEIEIKIILPLTNKSLYSAYGKSAGGGILLYGPPGCGKTYLAKATAGEVKASFIPVGLNDVLDMWIGQSEQKLHQIFEQARRNAPCVLFFDEVDALGASRADLRKSAGRQLINQFLSELDGISSSNEGVLILAATNAPWHLDNAFRRPGRFDRIVFVPPPDLAAREKILEIHLKDKPMKDINYKKLASKLNDYSGADIKAIVDSVIEDKLRVAIKTGVPEPISEKDLYKTAKKIRVSTKEWFGTARNYALYANESGIYDEILSHLNIKR